MGRRRLAGPEYSPHAGAVDWPDLRIPERGPVFPGVPLREHSRVCRAGAASSSNAPAGGVGNDNKPRRGSLPPLDAAALTTSASSTPFETPKAGASAPHNHNGLLTKVTSAPSRPPPGPLQAPSRPPGDDGRDKTPASGLRGHNLGLCGHLG
eukprot:2153135-Pyramimonas_sp.AAC.1